MPKGGFRPGAGRKPIGPAPMKAINVTLSTDDIEALKRISPNLSEAIRTLIARHSHE